jgi:hypothetical protein
MVMRFRILGVILVFIGIIALLPNQVSACNESKDGYLSIHIDEATYLDYDGDGYEDDIITIFTIDARDIDYDWSGKIHVECYLESPSGDIYSFDFKDKLNWIYWCFFYYDGYYGGYIGRIEQYGLVWFNTVTEAGWYEFSISVQGFGEDAPAPDYVETKFDPPDGGDPGLPEVGFM